MTSAPLALHRGEDEVPFVELADQGLGPSLRIQLLHADVEAGVWVIRARFDPGMVVPTHKHTGVVHAFTLAGRWKYAEYPEVNTAGSYLFEPAGSVHTLTVPADNDELTDVWFAISGANLNLDGDGNVVDVVDAGTIAERYLAACAAAGLERPDVIGRSQGGSNT